MKTLSSIIAGTAVLALANVALAEEPMALTDAQLDGVTAGAGTFSFQLDAQSSSSGEYYADGAWGNGVAANEAGGSVVSNSGANIGIPNLGGTGYDTTADAFSYGTGPGDVDNVDGWANTNGRASFGGGFSSTF